jgi:hypothetical protein
MLENLRKLRRASGTDTLRVPPPDCGNPPLAHVAKPADRPAASKPPAVAPKPAASQTTPLPPAVPKPADEPQADPFAVAKPGSLNWPLLELRRAVSLIFRSKGAAK